MPTDQPLPIILISMFFGIQNNQNLFTFSVKSQDIREITNNRTIDKIGIYGSRLLFLYSEFNAVCSINSRAFRNDNSFRT